MTGRTIDSQLSEELAEIRDAGLEKPERVLTTPQRARVGGRGGAREVR